MRPLPSALAAALACAALTSCSVADTTPVVHSTAGDPRQLETVLATCADLPDQGVPEPAMYTLNCDNDERVERLERLVWSDWGAEESTASGSLRYDPCQPECSESAARHVAVSVTATDQATLVEQPTYRTLRITASEEVPAGVTVDRVVDLSALIRWWSE